MRALTAFGGLLVSLVLATPAMALTLGPTSSAGGSGLRAVEFAGGFEMPVHVAAPSNEATRLYVVEQRGVIRLVQQGVPRPAPFLDIKRLVGCCGEQGLLSVAFHPNYRSNRKFYVDYTNRQGNTVIAEYRSNKARTRGVPGSRRALMRVAQPFGNHNGGQIAFGPDGLLYVGTGDGGSGGDPGNVAQKLGSRLGKMFTLNVNRKRAKPKMIAYGLRNPWRFSFDRKTGALFIGDVGQDTIEEIDYLKRGAIGRLHNYGWDAFEGRSRFEPGNLNSRGKLIRPLVQYNHSRGRSVTGGYVYRGASVPGARGRYFYGDFASGAVWSLRVVGGKPRGKRLEPFTVAGLSSFGEDAGGELYLVSYGGTIFRLKG